MLESAVNEQFRDSQLIRHSTDSGNFQLRI